MPLLRAIAPDHGDEVAEGEFLREEGTVDLHVALRAVVSDEADEMRESDLAIVPCSRISVAGVPER